MTIEWFRDLVIIILGLAAAISVLVIAVVAYLYYLRVKPVLESSRQIVKSAENITKQVESDIVGPLATMVTVVRCIRQAVNFAKQLKNKKEEC